MIAFGFYWLGVASGIVLSYTFRAGKRSEELRRQIDEIEKGNR